MSSNQNYSTMSLWESQGSGNTKGASVRSSDVAGTPPPKRERHRIARKPRATVDGQVYMFSPQSYRDGALTTMQTAATDDPGQTADTLVEPCNHSETGNVEQDTPVEPCNHPYPDEPPAPTPVPVQRPKPPQPPKPRAKHVERVSLFGDTEPYQSPPVQTTDQRVKAVPAHRGWHGIPAVDAGIYTPPMYDPYIPAQFGPPKYGRDYGLYDTAKKTEKEGFLRLLAELCRGINEPEQGMGRPRMSIADMVFATVYKVYSLFSLRRFTTDLTEAKEMGLIDRIPNFNTISKYMNISNMTPILMDLVQASAIPVNGLDHFALVDSTGFSTSRFVNWFGKKHGKAQDRKEWMKAHIVCGNISKIVMAVQITGWEGPGTGDNSQFVPLMERASKYFDFDAVAADKAYSAKHNFKLMELANKDLYVPFKSNAVKPGFDDVSGWARMYHMFRFQKEAFYSHYHQRSNVETAVHMIKSKFGDAIRSKATVAQINEVLAKVLCHNIVEVHKASVMMGLDPVMHAILPEPKAVPWHK